MRLFHRKRTEYYWYGIGVFAGVHVGPFKDGGRGQRARPSPPPSQPKPPPAPPTAKSGLYERLQSLAEATEAALIKVAEDSKEVPAVESATVTYWTPAGKVTISLTSHHRTFTVEVFS